MGNYVHVVKRLQEFGSYEAFNWKSDDFRSLLDSLGCNVGDDTDFECDAAAYKLALDALKMYKKNGNFQEVQDMLGDECLVESREDLDNNIDTLGGIDHVIKAMEMFWKERDKKYDCICFSTW